MKKITGYSLGLSAAALAMSFTSLFLTTNRIVESRRQNGWDNYNHKDAIMSLVGYNKCLVTGIHDWGSKDDWIAIQYTNGKGIIVPPKALEVEGIENLVYSYVTSHGRADPKETSPQQIRELNDFLGK